MRASPPAIATATATSNFTDAMHWFGTGTTMALWTSQAMSSIAGVQAEFIVSSPVNYAFDATFLSTITPCCRPSAFSIGLLDLDTGFPDESGDSILVRVVQAEDLATATHNGVATRHMFTGRLMRGLYDFGISSSGSSSGAFFFGPGSANGDFNFKLDFTPVDVAATPEPTSLLLLASGLAALVGRLRVNT